MRVRFEAAAQLNWPRWGRIRKPVDVPPGYTGNTVITEWLTLNCAGPWASKRSQFWLDVLFSAEADAERAIAVFRPQGLWMSDPDAGAAEPLEMRQGAR
jgi:hypothetical protein